MIIAHCQWRSKIPHFRRDKIPQATIWKKIPELKAILETYEWFMIRYEPQANLKR